MKYSEMAKVKFFALAILFAGISVFAYESTESSHVNIESNEVTTQAVDGVLMISVDGLLTDYVKQASEYDLDIPNMREIWEYGTRANGVRAALPSSTYPTHTTLITGASPANHGIVNNQPFDPYNTKPGRWYWYAYELEAVTLWEVLAQNGYEVGSVSWPVSVGMADIHYNIPEYMPTRSDEDILMTRATANPAGLMEELGREAGEYVTDAGRAVERDWSRTRYTKEMIKQKNPEFLSVHLTSTDRIQHQVGPFADEVYDVIEEVDEMIGQIIEAYREKYPNSAIAIVSDHGFAEVNYRVKIDAAFVNAGLITLSSRGNTLNSSTIEDWQAIPLKAGGSSAIILKDPEDQELKQEVADLLDGLAADPENGIANIYDSDDIKELKGNPDASFWVDLEPGYRSSAALTDPFVESISSRRGTHGYSPEQRTMDAVFFMKGPGIRESEDIGRIDMRNIAPTLAKYMNTTLPDAELAPLEIFD